MKHSNKHHNFSCSFCNDIFPSQLELVAHQVVKHRRSTSEEQRHQEAHISEEMPHFTCNHFTHSVPSQKNLNNHNIKFHTFAYGKCYKVFKDEVELDFHMDRTQDPTPRKLPAKHPKDKCLVRKWKE